MNERRSQRVSEAIREELAELIGYELDDPRLAGIDITSVLLTPDLHEARVLVSLADSADEAAALEALERASGYVRDQLARRLRLYRVPTLRFEPDSEVNPGRVRSLFRRVRRGRPRDAEAEKNPAE